MKVKFSLKQTGKEQWGVEGHGQSPYQSVSLEPTFDFFNSLTNEFVREINLRPGFKLLIVDFIPVQPMAVGFEVEKAPLEFSFCLSGKTRITFTNSTRCHLDEFYLGPGDCNISCFPESKGIMAYQPRKRVCGISIQIDPRFLQPFFKREFERIDAHPQFIKEAALNNHYFQYITMTPAMKIVVHHILNCRYLDFTERIYLESKALELIALQIAEIDLNRKIQTTISALRPAEKEQIRQAKDILISNLANPPSLLKLSRTVGLTHTKLNQGFREIYGTTAFNYLRQQRLEHGRLLLTEGQLNVSETAYATGFSNPSHFAKSFLTYFGIQPNTFLKKTAG